MRSDEGTEVIFKRYGLLEKISNKYFVDIGAGVDGSMESNTLFLCNHGYNGTIIECDLVKYNKLHSMFAQNICKINTKVTPHNVLNVLIDSPKAPGFLSLDIDTYDYFVLDAILNKFSPEIICAEINEKIPPPIRYRVNYIDENQRWNNDGCFGASIAMFLDFEKYGYKAFCVDYNNVYLSKIPTLPYREISELFDDGYKNKQDRRERYSWNNTTENWLFEPVIDAKTHIIDYFSDYINAGILTVE